MSGDFLFITVKILNVADLISKNLPSSLPGMHICQLPLNSIKLAYIKWAFHTTEVFFNQGDPRLHIIHTKQMTFCEKLLNTISLSSKLKSLPLELGNRIFAHQLNKYTCTMTEQ